MNKKYLVIGSIILIVLGLGCIENTSPKSGIDKEEISNTSESPETKQSTPSSVETTYNIGDIASDGITNIKLNSIRYYTVIDEKNNRQYIAKAQQGNVWLILDMTLEIIKNGEKRSYPQFSSFVVKDSEGFVYINHRIEYEALRNPLTSAMTIIYGDKLRGELAFEVPQTAKDLKFKFKFDDNNFAIFKLGDVQISNISISTPISTPVNKILVEHYAKRIDKLTKYGSEYQYPRLGMTFLVINLKITNQGYPMVKVNQFQWSLKVSTKDNPSSYIQTDSMFSSKDDGIECRDTELENGGWAICKIPFEVPENYDQYKIYWSGYNNANVEWKYVPE